MKMLLIVNLYLFWGAWQDLKRKAITNVYLWVGGVVGIVYRGMGLILDFFVLEEWIWALFPGILFLLAGKITKEKIGYGDGFTLLILGNFFTFLEVLYVLYIAVFFVMSVSFILICFKKRSKQYQIPFLPFLWVAETLLWL